MIRLSRTEERVPLRGTRHAVLNRPLPSIPDWRRGGGAGSSPPSLRTGDPPCRARAYRVYHPD